MAWIESHQNLREHPKVIALCGEMAWELDTTIGKLHRFWWWCLDYAPDGDLRKYNDFQIAFAAGVAATDAKRFVEAMVTGGGKVVSGFIDRDPYFRVHDWWDYAGRFLKTRWKNYPDKWEAVRSAYHGPATEGAPNTTPKTLPKPTNRTEPNETETEPKRTEPTDLSEVGLTASTRFFKGLMRGNGNGHGDEEQVGVLCMEVLGKDEMARCGSRWRRRAVDDPGKLRRVLLELRSMQKEGATEVRNPGACAEDLWGRFE
jgi:hypothetical protein